MTNAELMQLAERLKAEYTAAHWQNIRESQEERQNAWKPIASKPREGHIAH